MSGAMRPMVLGSLLGLLGVAGAAATIAQQQSPAAEPRLAGYREHLAAAAASPWRNLPWQFLGPTNMSGRMSAVAVVAPPAGRYTLYVGGASGGVWRSRNEGITWESVFDEVASTSVGDLAVDPSDPETIWVGTGEANAYRSTIAGAGLYRSPDGGDTWEYRGLAETLTIARIVVHPTDSDTVYVAASGHSWTDNPERGVYKTTDGGRSWERVLFVDERTAAIDLVIDPRDPETLYAAMWSRIRRKWSNPGHDPQQTGSGLFKSTDGGATWTPINVGLPAADRRGRIGIDIARSAPDVLYAFLDSHEFVREPVPGETDGYGRPASPRRRGSTVYRSDDGGASWSRTSQLDDYMHGVGSTYGFVFGQIRVDPSDPDRIYLLGIDLHVSDDAGRSFRRLGGMHADHHGLWIDPANSSHLVDVNDGGLAISYDAGENWRTFYDELPLVQFFNVAHSMGDPIRLYGSVQDHGSRRGTLDLSRGRHAIPPVPWEEAPGGEGSIHAVDPMDPDIVYAAEFYGSLFRTDMSTGERTELMPVAPPGEAPYRGQWLAPFFVSPHNPRVIYLGLNRVFRSMNRGDRWTVLSPDLSFNDPSRMGDIQYQTIYSLAESPLQFGLLYAGTDDGRAWVTDASATDGWREISAGLEADRVVSEIVASRWGRDTVFLAQNGKRSDDFRPHLWRSVDRGTTWVDIATDLPTGPVNVVREDPRVPDLLYVGTDVAAYVSPDGGITWEALPGAMPSTFVHDLVVHPDFDMMVAATHGRGMFALDLRPIQRATAEVRQSPLHVFAPEPVVLDRDPYAILSAPRSAAIHFWMAAAGRYQVSVLDAVGTELNSWSAHGDPGHNLATWDLTLAGMTQQLWGAEFPVHAEPGSYRVRVSAAAASAEIPLEIERAGTR